MTAASEPRHVSFESVVDSFERARQEEREESIFLARRLARRAGHNGVSSDALIAAATTGSTIPDDVRPWDLGDYGRCCEAFAIAPYSLRRKMLPQLIAWGELIEKELVERGR